MREEALKKARAEFATASFALLERIIDAAQIAPKKLCRPGAFSDKPETRREQFSWLGYQEISAEYFLNHGGVEEISRAMSASDYETMAVILKDLLITNADWLSVANAATGHAATLTQKKIDIRAWPFLVMYQCDSRISTIESVLEMAIRGEISLTQELVKHVLHAREKIVSEGDRAQVRQFMGQLSLKYVNASSSMPQSLRTACWSLLGEN